MSIMKSIRDIMLNYAENALKNAKDEYKKTKIKCTIINIVTFMLCAGALLLKTFVF